MSKKKATNKKKKKTFQVNTLSEDKYFIIFNRNVLVVLCGV